MTTMKTAIKSLLKNGIYNGKKFTANDLNKFFPFAICEQDGQSVRVMPDLNTKKLANDLERVGKRSIKDTGYFFIANEQANGTGYFTASAFAKNENKTNTEDNGMNVTISENTAYTSNLEKVVRAIRSGRINLERLCNGMLNSWYGHLICGTPLFCSYGQIGYTFQFDGVDVSVDYELEKIDIG